ncbi:DUF1801 domain-containing protein [soil metagenome]
MARCDTTSPDDSLAALPEDRRELIGEVRATILEHLPDGFEEAMSFGMLGDVVPLEAFGDTYNGEPLRVLALANQKNHVSVYLMGVYGSDAERDWFVDAWNATGKELDMGKACVRLKRADDVAFDVLAEAVARVQPADQRPRQPAAEVPGGAPADRRSFVG